VAGGPSEGSSWVGWEGVDCRAASRRELSVAACRCSANMCCRLLEAVEIVVGDGDVRVDGLREFAC
jgi:hypothetical protein